MVSSKFHTVEKPLFNWKRKKDNEERRTEAFFPSLLLNGFLFHVIDFHRDLPFTQKRGPAAAAHYYSVVVAAKKGLKCKKQCCTVWKFANFLPLRFYVKSILVDFVL